MKNRIFYVIAFFLVCFVGAVVFLANKEKKSDNTATDNGNKEEYSRVFGQVEVIAGDHLGVVVIEKSQKDEGSLYLAGNDYKQVDLGVKGDTPVFLFNSAENGEVVSQMAELEWRDYAIIQYDDSTKEIKKILILRDDESIIKEMKS